MPSAVSFEQDPNQPPGTGTFTLDDGSQMMASHPELAAQLSSAPMQDTLVSQQRPVASPEAMTSDLVAKDQGQPAPDPVMPLNGGYSAAPAPAAGPTVNASVQPVTDIGNIDEWGNQQRAQRQQAEAAAYNAMSPVDRQRAAVQSYMTAPEAPQRGPGGPNAAQRKIAQLDAAIQRANVAKAENEIAQNEEQKWYHASQAGIWQQKATEQAAEAAKVQNAVDQDRADLDSLISAKESKEQSFDPNRWYSDRGTVGNIGAMLAQAFGVYSAILGKTPNFVGEQIKGYINADIAKQEAEIRAAGHKADNALARLTRRYGDRDQAKAALMMAQQNAADQMVKYYAAGQKQQEIQDAANVYLAQSEKDKYLEGRKFATAGASKHQQIMQRAQEVKALQDTGVLPNPNATAEQEAKRAEAGAKRDAHTAEQVQKYGEKRQAIIDAEEQIKDVARKAGITFDPQTGAASIPEGHDIPGKGATGWVPTALLPDEAAKLRQSLAVLAQKQTKAVSGATSTPEEKADIRAGIEGYYDSGLVEGLGTAWQALQSQKKGMSATFSPDVRDQYEAQLRETVRRDQAAAIPVGEAVGRVR